MSDRLQIVESDGGVTQPWVRRLGWKQQSILFSSLRGPDAPNVPSVKAINRWMRGASQFNADPSKHYMAQTDLPHNMKVCDELEFLPVHYVHHLADGLAVIAYGHPEMATAAHAARLHYDIAEELFHFHPEPPHFFKLRHRDKPDGQDSQAGVWSAMWEDARSEFIDAVLEDIGER